jgi:glycosyltransferase involved in cell wall biosynthesis
MKILHIVHKPQRRGAEVFALQLSQQLRSMGHDVEIVYLYRHDETNALPPVEYDRRLAGYEHHSFERIPGVHPLLLRRLSQLVENLRPDIVQVNGGRTVKYGALVASLHRRRGWALIYRNIGEPRDWLRGWRHAIYLRLVAPNFDGVVGVSQTTLQAISDLYQLSVPVAHIPCAIDPAAIVPSFPREVVRSLTETPLDAPVVVSVGSLSPEKRLDRLLRAVAVVKRNVPNLHLWIVGGGRLRSDLETQVRALSLAPCVRFVGIRENVADYLSAGDVAALTSDTEGMPAVLLEAGLLGRPVVSTRVGGVSECVVDGRTGLLVEPSDEESLATALCGLLQQPERRRRMGTDARAWVERNFSMGQVAQQYCSFYERVLAR